MKGNYIDKKYIYLRENQRCYYCNKLLKLGQVTLDHYQPRSKGGAFDYYNLVCACKRCNMYKKASLPLDTDKVHVTYFKQAVKDKKIVCSSHRITKEEFLNYVEQIDHLLCKDGQGEASGRGIILFIKESKVYQVERVKS